MTIQKKMLIFGAASITLLGVTVGYAGGPDVPACPVCISSFVPFTYIGFSAGWAYSDWNNFIFNGAPSDADTNGFTYGGKLGYQFLDHFGIEGGGFVLPESDQTLPTTIVVNGVVTPSSLSGSVDSWFAYGAATIRANLPGNPFFHIIGKVGGVYRAVNHSGNLYNSVDDGGYGTVIFGGTLEYDLAANNLPIAVGVDYLYIPGSIDSWSGVNSLSENAAPAAQVVVGTLSFRLAV